MKLMLYWYVKLKCLHICIFVLGKSWIFLRLIFKFKSSIYTQFNFNELNLLNENYKEIFMLFQKEYDKKNYISL